MAHNIGHMFYVGATPWHTLGTRLNGLATAEEALKHGHLDWEVELAPLALRDHPGVTVPHRRAVVRCDREPGAPDHVLGVVHPNFRLLQNRTGAQMFDRLLGEGQPHYNTGGYLKNGEVVWLQAKLKDTIRLPGDDDLETYLLFSNSHDGSYAIDIRLTTVRVVCNNTLNVALEGKHPGQTFRRGHSLTASALDAEVSSFFGWITGQNRTLEERLTVLCHEEMDDATFSRFLDRLLPLPAKPASAETSKSVARRFETLRETVIDSRKAITDVRLNGLKGTGALHPQIDAAPPTWWGGLNSVTAWVDHVQAVDADHYVHIMFGDGDRLKQKALALATVMLAE